jgi:hypothetical protein
MSGLNISIEIQSSFDRESTTVQTWLVQPENDGHGYQVEVIAPTGRYRKGDRFGHVTRRGDKWGTGYRWHQQCDGDCPVKQLTEEKRQ